jgi:hypothetical protein
MRKIVPALVLAVALMGCAKNPIHPGTANKFDSDSDDVLIVTDSLIKTTETDLTNGAFPASIAGNVKTALNDLIKGYDAARGTYLVYHNAAMAGKATAAQSTDVSAALADVNAKTSALTAAKASKK